jgi:uncharacterized protein
MRLLSQTKTEARRGGPLVAVLTNRFVAGYLLVYGVLLAVLHQQYGFQLAEPLALLLLVGIAFSALAWLATRGLTPLPFRVQQPSREAVLLLGYLLAVVAFLTWGLHAIHRIAPPWDSPAILAAKLFVFVLLPAVLLAETVKYRIPELFTMSASAPHMKAALWMTLAMIVVQAIFGRGISDLHKSGLSAAWIMAGAPLVLIWLLVEVGLVEEFFFRTLLQSRLAALLRSEVAAIVLMSVLFGLAHAPGFYLRTASTMEALGPHPSWLMAIGYAVVVTSVTGFFLGVLWARTRNLAVVVLVHAATDLLPSLTPALTMWRNLLQK